MASDPLTQAILAAGAELGREHNYSFGDCADARPDEQDEFTTVLFKHIAPLLSLDGLIQARCEMLRSELAVLEAMGAR